MPVLKNAYLPKGKILAAVGDIWLPGIDIIRPYRAETLPKPLWQHADLTFSYLGEGVCVCAPESYDYYKKALEKYPVKLLRGGRRLEDTYPNDCAYNIAIVGKRVFCRTDAVDEVLLTEAEKRGFKIIDIRQGYSKCSVCPITENAAISADVSFCRAAEREGVECLLITNEGISLPGYDTGFFGGCAFMADEKTISAKGELKSHPDYEKIKSFLGKFNIAIKTLCGGPLTDFGSLCVIIANE